MGLGSHLHQGNVRLHQVLLGKPLAGVEALDHLIEMSDMITSNVHIELLMAPTFRTLRIDGI